MVLVTDEKKSAATTLVELIEAMGVRLIRDQYGEAFLLMTMCDANDANDAIPRLLNPLMSNKSENVKNRLVKIASPASLASLTRYPIHIKHPDLTNIFAKRFYDQEGKTITRGAIDSALQVVAGRDSPRYTFWNRVAEADDGSWWLDIGDGRAVWIDEDGWTITDDPQVYFRHYTHQLPLRTPTPDGEGDLYSLLDFVNLPDCDSQLLYVVTAVATLVPSIPHPLLYLYGGHGTVKTGAQEAIKEVFDRSSVGMIRMPDDLNQLSQILDHHWICFFDNLSRLDDGQSDALCRAVTGAGMSKRALYTDDADVTRWYRRCVGVNGIGIVSDKPDLTNRSIILETKPITERQRRTDSEIQGERARLAGQILGDALNVVVKARKLISGGFKIEDKPRMADFALWGAAITESLGIKAEFFLNAYRANIREAEATIARGNVVGGLLIDYLENKLAPGGEVSFTAHQLYTTLREKAQSEMYNLKTDFPGDPRWLSNKVRELAPVLPAAGFSVSFKRSGRERAMVFTKFSQAKLNNPVEYQAVPENNWPVDDLRKIRGNVLLLRGGVEAVPAPKPAVERASLGFARKAILMSGYFSDGLGVSLDRLQEVLDEMGLSATESVKLLSSMIRVGELIVTRPGYVIKGVSDNG